MSIFFLILLISLIFINCLKIKKYNVKPYNEITLEDETSCVCFELHDDTKTDNSFYLQVYSEDEGAKINKIIYYNYLDLCDCEDNCENDSYKHLNQNNNRISEKEDSDGFSFEYEFKLDDNKHRAFLIQYRDFKGNKLKMKYSSYLLNANILIIIICACSFIIIVVIIIIIVIIIKKRKIKELENQINRITFIVD